MAQADVDAKVAKGLVRTASKGFYDPAKQLYNWKASNTRTWRRGIARNMSGGTAAGINCYGPSTVAGYTIGGRSEFHAWPSYLRRLLTQRFGESGSGVIYFMEPDARVSVNSGALWNVNEYYGPFGRSCYSSDSTSASMTFGPVRATGFKVTYLTAPGAGVISAAAEGRYPTTVDTNAAFGVSTVALPAGELGDHTLTIKPNVNGKRIFIIGVEAYVGPTSSWISTGVRVTNVGKGSTVVGNLVYGDTWLDSSLKSAVDVNSSDLAIIAFAENSPSYQTPEEFKTDMRSLINRIKPTWSDILLCTSVDWEGDLPEAKAPQALYDNAVYQLADEYDLPVFDIAARWGTYGTSPGYYADRIHQSPTGNADIAGGLLSVILTGIS